MSITTIRSCYQRQGSVAEGLQQAEKAFRALGIKVQQQDATSISGQHGANRWTSFTIKPKDWPKRVYVFAATHTQITALTVVCDLEFQNASLRRQYLSGSQAFYADLVAALGPLGDPVDCYGSIMEAGARYVGGHPRVPTSQPAVLALSGSVLSFHPTEDRSLERVVAVVPLGDILRVTTGQPKTAREIYDQARDRTVIDVTEQSPFVSITFQLTGDCFAMSFSDFTGPYSVVDWCNQIIAQRYQHLHPTD